MQKNFVRRRTARLLSVCPGRFFRQIHKPALHFSVAEAKTAPAAVPGEAGERCRISGAIIYKCQLIIANIVQYYIK